MTNRESRSAYVNGARLKTARRKRQLVKIDFDKHLIQLDKKRTELWDKKRALPLVPLKEPYQRGWERYFVLREDVARSKDALFYKTILEKINTTQYSSEKTFKKKKKRRKGVYVDRNQFLKEFSESEWNSPKLVLDDKEKIHFYKRERWCSNFKRYKIHYVFNESWRYVLRVRPNMITHTKMVDEVLEQEIDQLENYITSNFLRCKIAKLVRGREKYIWDYGEIKLKYQDPLKNKPIHIIMNEYRDECRYTE